MDSQIESRAKLYWDLLNT